MIALAPTAPVNAPPEALLVFGAGQSGDQAVGADADAHKQIDQQIDQGAGGADRRHRGMAAAQLAHHDDIGGIVQQLQNAGQN